MEINPAATFFRKPRRSARLEGCVFWLSGISIGGSGFRIVEGDVAFGAVHAGVDTLLVTIELLRIGPLGGFEELCLAVRWQWFIGQDELWKIRGKTDQVSMAVEAGDPRIVDEGVRNFSVAGDMMGEGTVTGFTGETLVDTVEQIVHRSPMGVLFILVTVDAGLVASMDRGTLREFFERGLAVGLGLAPGGRYQGVAGKEEGHNSREQEEG